MSSQSTTLGSFGWALLVCQVTRRGPFPGSHMPGKRGEKHHPLEARLYCIDLTGLQQLHGLHHEGCRMPSTAFLQDRRYQHQGCLFLVRLRTRWVQLEVLQVAQGAERDELYGLGIGIVVEEILHIAACNLVAACTRS